MKRNFFLQLIIFSFILTVAGGGGLSAAPVPAPEAKTWAESRGNALLEAFNEPRLNIKYQKLDKMLLDYVDLDYISRFVIGKHWRQMNVVQQEKYRQLFKRYALALYKNFPLSFGSRLSFRIGRIFQSGEATVVQTLISLPDKETV